MAQQTIYSRVEALEQEVERINEHSEDVLMGFNKEYIGPTEAGNPGINDLCTEAHNNAVEKGFYDTIPQIGTMIALIISELTEALKADQGGKRSSIPVTYGCVDEMIAESNFKTNFEFYFKDYFNAEIADTFIRLFDLCGALEIDIESHIKLGMAYNKLRDYKHGKEY